jgi:hypothetical protein
VYSASLLSPLPHSLSLPLVLHTHTMRLQCEALTTRWYANLYQCRESTDSGAIFRSRLSLKESLAGHGLPVQRPVASSPVQQPPKYKHKQPHVHVTVSAGC